MRASRFDADKDKETGKRPYQLYLTHDMPAYYKIFTPKNQAETLDKIKKEGSKWSYSKALKDVGADIAYLGPCEDRHRQIPGHAGRQHHRFARHAAACHGRQGERQAFHAAREGAVPVRGQGPRAGGGDDARRHLHARRSRSGRTGSRQIHDRGAYAGKEVKSEPVTFENKIHFPNVYLANAGTSLNMFGPFFLTLAIAIFGVLMGAGGGFIMNPLFVSLWPLPHTVVAGTVMPTVLFSQGSGIYNYSKIKFISWKLGVAIGLAMVLGGFIGPKLTEMITLDQFKFVFGWILLVLAGLMFWQTTPGYLEKNKKEQAILNEFKKKAEAEAKAKKA